MRHVLFVLVAVCSLAPSTLVRAQDYSDDVMSTLRFRPAAGPGNFWLMEGAVVLDHLRTSTGLWLEAGGPMLRQEGPACAVENAICTEPREAEELRSIPFNAFGHFSFALGLFDRAQLALDVPLGGNSSKQFFSTYSDPDDDSIPPTQINVSDRPQDGFVVADPRLLAKVFLWGNDRLATAVSAHTTVPLARVTGRNHYVGERTVQAGGSLIGEASVSMLRFGLNVGALYRPRSTYLMAATGTELTYGMAAELRPAPKIALTLEGNGSVVVLGHGKHPAEVLFGMSLGQYSWRVHVGAGVGLTDAVGVPDGRGFLALVYTPRVYDKDGDGLEDPDDGCPTVAEDRDGFEDADGCPELDNDGDGIEDTADQCPDEPEDPDGFEDEDGCPELDNDRDGVPDGYDSCPHEQEDRDGDRDNDGCIDDDTDRDGIKDAQDACPTHPEDTDGLGDEDGCPDADFDRDGIDDEYDSCPEEPELFNDVEDDDGCPEPDRDGDAVRDDRDRCPTVPETLNGTQDWDGCADGPARLQFAHHRLVPTAPLLFEEDGVTLSQPRTFATLDVAVSFIDRHHRSGRIAIVVHAPAEDPKARARGEAVLGYLGDAGIAPARMYVDHVAGDPRIELELVGIGVDPRPDPRESDPETESGPETETESE